MPFRRHLSFAIAVALLTPVASASAATTQVTTTADQFATGPGCSVREAIQGANTNADFGGCDRVGTGLDTIVLKSGKTYTRTITGSGDQNDTGDLDINSDMSLRTSASGRATIDAAQISRVLDVFNGAQVTVSRINLKNGKTLPDDTPDGAGVLLAPGSSLTVSRGTISDNYAVPGNGGGIESAGRLKLSRVNLSNNSAVFDGGGILITGGTANLSRVRIRGGGSKAGGGIDNRTGKATLTDVALAGNEVQYSGGAIYNGDRMTLGRVTIDNNRSYRDGGGLYADGSGHPQRALTTLTNVTIQGNRADRSGGGIYQTGEFVQVHNATIAGNTADADGVQGTNEGHGGGTAGDEVTILYNSIVAGNLDLNDSSAPDCYGNPGFVSGGHNLLGNDAYCGFTPATGDVVGKAPKLFPLANNGGFTKTLLPKSNSPAIGHGSPKTPGSGADACARRDQRGVGRPQGTRCDIGAVERR